jgi:hypothetical protein
MESNNIFSPARFYYLIKRYYSLNYKTMLLAFLGVAGVLAIIGALATIGKTTYRHDVLVALFYVVMFLAGFILTSGIFNELHKPERSIHYITLPASSFEKLFSAWVQSTLFYFIFSIITFYIAYLLSSVLAFWWLGTPISWFNIFSTGFIKMCGLFMVIHSIFFFGAVYFRGANFLKTIFAIFLFFLAYSMYQTLFSTVVNRDIIMLLIQHKNVEDLISAPGLEEFMQTRLIPAAKIFFLYVIPVFFLILSYVRIKEREV